jgi:hypothetical protein
VSQRASAAEFRRTVGPSAGFHAANRHGEIGSTGNQETAVEHAVLLGADEVFSCHQENQGIGLVGYEESIHSLAFANLANFKRFGSKSFVHGLVCERLPVFPAESKRLQSTVALWLGHLHVLKQFSD